jgi:hypothetical protein
MFRAIPRAANQVQSVLYHYSAQINQLFRNSFAGVAATPLCGYNLLVATATLGRPTLYTQDIANAICERLAKGESLRSICLTDGFPAPATVCGWTTQNKDFYEQYAQARANNLEMMAEDLLSISDDGADDWETRYKKDGSEYQALNRDAVERSRLMVDTRKWLLSKLRPKQYGDRLDVSGEIDCKLSVQFSIAPAAHLARVELPASVRALLPAPGVARSAELPGEQSAK